ncbi:hypothetical protein AAG747_01170 [Rapidithrix thailandica]|uniref:Uncharacterized protein n=1 Tax=Rapidithrix thailandica TaxID=413964 RepID=A0AAW9RSD8_9BACT
MKFNLLFAALLLWSAFAHATEDEDNATSPSARVELQQQSVQEENVNITPAPATSQVKEAPKSFRSALEEAIEELPAKKQEKAKRKLERMSDKKLAKIEKKIITRIEKQQSNPSFEDVVVLTGGIVAILGLITVLFSPIGGLIAIAIGLAAFFIGRYYGGDYRNVFN